MLLFAKDKSVGIKSGSLHQEIRGQDKLVMNKDQMKYRIYCLIYDLQSKKEQTLKPLNLPEYKIPWITNSKGEQLKMSP